MQEILINQKNYPKLLKEIPKAPKKIFVKGDVALLNQNAIAIVGSRKCTSYGKKIAFEFASELAKAGLVIVSGLAFGIDSEAHKGALNASGKTIAVLGSSLDNDLIYPKSNLNLAYEIINSKGALVSEYPPKTQARPYFFPERNRIISGLSLGVLVVEAEEKSGSLITAEFALEQNREVFAVPGSIFSKSSAGTNRLIQQGAKLVSSPDDILEELKIKSEYPTQQNLSFDFTKTEFMIINLIKNNINKKEEILKLAKIPTNEVLSALSLLELKGIIKASENNYTLNQKI